MEKQNPASNPDIWLLMGKIHHKRVLVRQRELSKYHIPTRQLYILQLIRELGGKATLSAIAKKVERKMDVVSRQTVIMEKDGLIKRTKAGVKTRLLIIELTEKGLDLAKISGKSKAMDEIISVLNPEEHQQLYSLLNKILVKLNDYPI
jgi:DNA-binding MarR family transcriptional regulator